VAVNPNAPINDAIRAAALRGTSDGTRAQSTEPVEAVKPRNGPLAGGPRNGAPSTRDPIAETNAALRAAARRIRSRAD
jgi:hypothetical protein